MYFAALLHADAAIENLLIQELSRAWFDRFGEWVEHDWELRDGFIAPSDRPGLGIRVREEVVVQLAYDQPMAYRQYRHEDGSWTGW